MKCPVCKKESNAPLCQQVKRMVITERIAGVALVFSVIFALYMTS